MRKVEPKRFLKKQPEEFEFQGESIPDSPPPKSEESKEVVPPSARPDGRTSPKEPQVEPREPGNAYIITIPEERRKVRHPFDIYDDQLEAMKKLQIAIREVSGSKAVPTLGDMARAALDVYVEQLAAKAPNVRLTREQQEGPVV